MGKGVLTDFTLEVWAAMRLGHLHQKTGGDHETRLAMTSKSWISRLGALLIALVLTVAPSGWPVHAVEGARKVSVVSFGLFGPI